MEHLIHGVRDAIRKECWYPALAQALAIPDTCGAIDLPGRGKSRKRYTAWFDKYIAQDFRSSVPHSQQFFTADDMYLLRCAYLHEGDMDFDEPGAPKFNGGVVEGATLFLEDRGSIVPSLGGTGSMQYMFGLEDLCELICRGAEAWLVDTRKDPRKVDALSKLKRIIRFTESFEWKPV